MAYRVFLSPSDQKKNAYAYGNTNEAEVCGKIAEATKAALMRCGIEVDMTQYEPMSSKCAKSDAFGANLHVPIHTNAYNHQVAGTRIMCSSMSGEGYRAANAIFDVLAPITPGTSENVSAHPELYEIRVASAPLHLPLQQTALPGCFQRIPCSRRYTHSQGQPCPHCRRQSCL